MEELKTGNKAILIFVWFGVLQPGYCREAIQCIEYQVTKLDMGFIII